jgi:nucleotide-binding universal stress UspA family protein
MFVLNRILVPTNLGETSKAAIRYGVAFARQFDARLYVIHVLSEDEFETAIETERVIEELLPEAVPEGAIVDDNSPGALARNAAREELSELLSPDDESATRAEYLIRAAKPGKPGDTIVECAAELDVELIIMGKHRQGFVDHLLSGSVTEKVVRDAPCPVLIVHYPEHEFIVEDEED